MSTGIKLSSWLWLLRHRFVRCWFWWWPTPRVHNPGVLLSSSQFCINYLTNFIFSPFNNITHTWYKCFICLRLHNLSRLQEENPVQRLSEALNRPQNVLNSPAWVETKALASDCPPAHLQTPACSFSWYSTSNLQSSDTNLPSHPPAPRMLLSLSWPAGIWPANVCMGPVC